MSIAVTDPKVKMRTATGWFDPFTGIDTPILFPTRATTGVDAIPGWEPRVTITDDNLRILENDAVYEDVLVDNGGINVEASRVTLRRCKVIDGTIRNQINPDTFNGLMMEDCTIQKAPPLGGPIPLNAAVWGAGFTMRRCAVLDTSEGLSIGGTTLGLTDPTHPWGYGVRLFDCFFQQRPAGEGTEECDDYHGDTIQAVDDGNGGTPLLIRNCYMGSADRFPYCGSSSIYGNFYNDQQPPDVDRLLMSGGAITIRNFCGGSWKNVLIENDTWAFYSVGIPEDAWPSITHWDCVHCTIGVDGQPDELIARVPFGYPGFGPLDPV